MEKIFDRTIALLGKDNFDKLQKTHVTVAGTGGVGSYVIEGLVRSGIGKIRMIDFDQVDLSNLNRQLQALHSTVGMAKIDVLKSRILDINPNCEVEKIQERIDAANFQEVFLAETDYLVDAIDDVPAKIALIQQAWQRKIPIISSMGTANKILPEKLMFADISKTEICPLARVMRKGLREKGITKGVQVLYSREEISNKSRNILGSVSFVPSVAGLMIAGKVIRDICEKT